MVLRPKTGTMCLKITIAWGSQSHEVQYDRYGAVATQFAHTAEYVKATLSYYFWDQQSLLHPNLNMHASRLRIESENVSLIMLGK